MQANTQSASIDFEETVKGVRIPPQPTILLDLRKEQAKPYPNIERIAGLISQDISLSAAVLKTINSPYYGIPRKIQSIGQAVVLLGIENISTLVTTTTLRNAIQNEACISLERFWDSSCDIANISRVLSRNLYIESPDISYTLGLFHDCGIALMAQKFNNYFMVLEKGNSSMRRSLTDIEDEHYHTNHAVVGYFTCKSWGLPKLICELVKDHHSKERIFLPGDDHIQRNQIMAVLKLAGNISYTFRHLSVDYEWEQSKEQTLEILGLDKTEYEEIKMDTQAMLDKD